MNTKNLVSLLLAEDLDETFRIVVGLCTRVGAEWEFPDNIFGLGGFQLLLCLANPSNLGVSVDDGGNSGIVDVTMAVLDILDGSDTWKK